MTSVSYDLNKPRRRPFFGEKLMFRIVVRLWSPVRTTQALSQLKHVLPLLQVTFRWQNVFQNP